MFAVRLPVSPVLADLPGLALRAAPLLAIALIFAVGAEVNQYAGPHDEDISWYLHMSERILAGERLYIDVWDVNPPLPSLMYLPAVALEGLTGVKGEIWVSVMFAGAVTASLALMSLLLKAGDVWSAQRRALFIVCAAAVFVFVMPHSFAQREHFGIVLASPMVLGLALRGEFGRAFDPGPKLMALVGLAAAVILMVKPHYAVGLGAPILAVALFRRDWRALFPVEALTVAGLVLAYAAVTLALFPEFLTDVLPALTGVYMAERASLAYLAARAAPAAAFALGLIACMAVFAPTGGGRRASIIWLVSTLGFFLGYFANAKGWAYHLVPGLTAAFLGLAALVIGRLEGASRGVALALLAATCFLFVRNTSAWTIVEARPDLGVQRIAPHVDKPVLAVFGERPQAGNPLARVLDAAWTERDNCDFFAILAHAQMKRVGPERAAELNAFVDEALERKAAYFRKTDVELVVFDLSHPSWYDRVREHAELDDILNRFDLIFQQGETRYYLRRDLARKAGLSAPAG